MFTGLVEEVGRVERVELLPSGRGRRVVLSARLLEEPMAMGASLAVDGVCLTVVSSMAGRADVVVGPETLERSTIGALTEGCEVNLEQPLRLGDRLGGHLVAGHVDGVGRIAARSQRGEALDVVVEAPPSLLRYVIEKGSIAVDGASLTVNQIDARSFSVSLIPHTIEKTTLAKKSLGAGVNLEVDLVGKYIEKLLGGRAPDAAYEPTMKEQGLVHK